MKGLEMPKQSPIPDDLDRPFYEAANQDKLVLQYCPNHDYWIYPPEPTGPEGEIPEWREVPDGTGTIYSYAVVYDTPIASLQADQPFNCAVITLDSCPGINFLSHLPGTPPGEVEIGAKVELIFEATPATGQKVPEWRVIK
jgi:uncharacterized OB-fold protein